MVVAGSTRALAVAFAARRSRAAGGAARVVAFGRSRRHRHRADVRSRCVGNRPDAKAWHALAVVGPHSHRFRQGRICTAGTGCCADRGCLCGAGLARNPAFAAARSRNPPAVPVPFGGAVRSRHRRASNGASAAAVRSSAARPTPSTSRTSREHRHLPVFRPDTPRPLLRWPSPSPRCGQRRGWRWPSMP